MTDWLPKLSDADIRALITALDAGRVAPPYSALQLSRILPPVVSNAVTASLSRFAEQGFTPEQISSVLQLLIKDRAGRSMEPPIDLVTSGPEAPEITNRDTSVVVRELFAHAQTSVLVVGYAVHQGQRVFEALANRMEELPELDVQLFLNISRPDKDTAPPEFLVSRFRQRFRDSQWPNGCRLPEVYYDPRSVADDAPVRSSLHAKCVVVDGERVFVSSANFTGAGQERNIEVGLGIRSDWLAGQLSRHFKLLAEQGLMQRAL